MWKFFMIAMVVVLEIVLATTVGVVFGMVVPVEPIQARMLMCSGVAFVTGLLMLPLNVIAMDKWGYR